MWYDENEESVDLYVRAGPGSSRNEIVGIYEDALKVRIKAPAVEGAANRELVKFLAKRFKVPKSAVSFLSGETSRRKKIRLPKSERLMQFIEEMNEKNTADRG